MDNCSVYMRGVFSVWKCLCCCEPRENIWPSVYTKKWQKTFSGWRGKKWNLMGLMGNKINISGTFPWEFSRDQWRWGQRTHLHRCYRASLIQHIFTALLVISCFPFIIRLCLISPPWKWQQSNCSLASVNKKSKPSILHVFEQRARVCGNSNLAKVWWVVSFLSATTKQKQTFFFFTWFFLCTEISRPLNFMYLFFRSEVKAPVPVSFSGASF